MNQYDEQIDDHSDDELPDTHFEGGRSSIEQKNKATSKPALTFHTYLQAESNKQSNNPLTQMAYKALVISVVLGLTRQGCVYFAADAEKLNNSYTF